MSHVVAVAVGGAAGSLCRYAVSCVCLRWLGAYYVFGTLAVNVVGCFLVGLFIESRVFGFGEVAHSALAIGFIGALTTFSTFGWETTRFFQDAQPMLAFLNIAGNMLLGLAAVYCGLHMARWWLS